MSTIQRMTVTLTAEIAEAVRQAVEAGEYASGSEIVREALRDWKHKRALREQELMELRARVQEGLSDIEAGRVHDFDAARIIRKGEQQFQNPEPSA
jgi:antitoxin ParD1/3/4